jgi:hypothetical protein
MIADITARKLQEHAPFVTQLSAASGEQLQLGDEYSFVAYTGENQAARLSSRQFTEYLAQGYIPMPTDDERLAVSLDRIASHRAMFAIPRFGEVIRHVAAQALREDAIILSTTLTAQLTVSNAARMSSA